MACKQLTETRADETKAEVDTLTHQLRSNVSHNTAASSLMSYAPVEKSLYTRVQFSRAVSHKSQREHASQCAAWCPRRQTYTATRPATIVGLQLQCFSTFFIMAHPSKNPPSTALVATCHSGPPPLPLPGIVERCVVMSVSVSVFVREHISGTTLSIFANLKNAFIDGRGSRSSSGGVAIRYVFLVYARRRICT